MTMEGRRNRGESEEIVLADGSLVILEPSVSEGLTSLFVSAIRFGHHVERRCRGEVSWMHSSRQCGGCGRRAGEK